MDFVILETNIYEVIYGVYIYMSVSEGQSKRVLHAGSQLDTFCCVDSALGKQALDSPLDLRTPGLQITALFGPVKKFLKSLGELKRRDATHTTHG